jgi:hypothetical protein
MYKVLRYSLIDSKRKMKLKKLEKIEAGRIRLIQQSTELSEDSLVPELKNHFEAKVILVNHEKRLSVDTACANLAIKYNFLYISVY